MPALRGGRFDQALPRGCIHCHDVQKGLRDETRPKGKPVPDAWLWRFPMPNALGLVLDRDQRATVADVTRDSAAAAAGLRKGDRITSIAGQVPVSIADVQWALEHAASPGTVDVVVARGADTTTLALPLAAGWRRVEDFTWRESTWAQRPGLCLDPLTADERRTVGGGKDVVGLKVRNAWPGQAAAKAGFRAGDVFVALAGQTTPMASELEFLVWLYQQAKPGDDVVVVVARGDKRVTLRLPVP
jgi:S1-C subfamily serine protease